MAEGRNIKVSGVDFGAIAVAVMLATWMAITAWNWNSARDDCATVLAAQSSEGQRADGNDIRECAEELLD